MKGKERTAPLKNRKIMMLAVFFERAQPTWNLQDTNTESAGFQSGGEEF